MAWSRSTSPWAGVVLLLISLLSWIDSTLAAEPTYIQATSDTGEAVYLLDDRKPALYTQNFGDCLGSSLINVTRFDAAYYRDNMTVLFHLEGNTAVANESVMRMWTSAWCPASGMGLTARSLHWRFCLRRGSLRLDL